MIGGDGECRIVADGRQDVTFEAEPRRSERQHAAKLSAAKDADC